MKKKLTIAILGPPGSGKTSLALTWANKKTKQTLVRKVPELYLDSLERSTYDSTVVIDTNSGSKYKNERVEAVEQANCVIFLLRECTESLLEGPVGNMLSELTPQQDHMGRIIFAFNSQEDLMSKHILQQFLEERNCSNFEIYGNICLATESGAEMLLHRAVTVSLFPVYPLYDEKNSLLTPGFEAVLIKVFFIFDQDSDLLLNDMELSVFHREMYDIPLNPRALAQLKGMIESTEKTVPIKSKYLKGPSLINNCVTLRGFYFLFLMLLRSLNVAACWSFLRKMGYNDELEVGFPASSCIRTQDLDIRPSSLVPIKLCTMAKNRRGTLSSSGVKFFSQFFTFALHLSFSEVPIIPRLSLGDINNFFTVFLSLSFDELVGTLIKCQTPLSCNLLLDIEVFSRDGATEKHFVTFFQNLARLAPTEVCVIASRLGYCEYLCLRTRLKIENKMLQAQKLKPRMLIANMNNCTQTLVQETASHRKTILIIGSVAHSWNFLQTIVDFYLDEVSSPVKDLLTKFELGRESAHDIKPASINSSVEDMSAHDRLIFNRIGNLASRYGVELTNTERSIQLSINILDTDVTFVFCIRNIATMLKEMRQVNNILLLVDCTCADDVRFGRHLERLLSSEEVASPLLSVSFMFLEALELTAPSHNLSKDDNASMRNVQIQKLLRHSQKYCLKAPLKVLYPALELSGIHRVPVSKLNVDQYYRLKDANNDGFATIFEDFGIGRDLDLGKPRLNKEELTSSDRNKIVIALLLISISFVGVVMKKPHI